LEQKRCCPLPFPPGWQLGFFRFHRVGDRETVSKKAQPVKSQASDIFLVPLPLPCAAKLLINRLSDFNNYGADGDRRWLCADSDKRAEIGRLVFFPVGINIGSPASNTARTAEEKRLPSTRFRVLRICRNITGMSVLSKQTPRPFASCRRGPAKLSGPYLLTIGRKRERSAPSKANAIVKNFVSDPTSLPADLKKPIPPAVFEEHHCGAGIHCDKIPHASEHFPLIPRNCKRE